MLNQNPSTSGVNLQQNYMGRHRESQVPNGRLLIPLGDRDRVSFNEIFLVGNAEEAESVDRTESRKR